HQGLHLVAHLAEHRVAVLVLGRGAVGVDRRRLVAVNDEEMHRIANDRLAVDLRRLTRIGGRRDEADLAVIVLPLPGGPGLEGAQIGGRRGGGVYKRRGRRCDQGNGDQAGRKPATQRNHVLTPEQNAASVKAATLWL